MAKGRGKVTREKIIEIATELIDEHGYHGMSLGDVASRLGVTRPALYYYYSRKDELLLDIHNRAQSRLVESSRDIHNLELQPLNRLHMLLANHALIAATNARVVAVMFEEEHNLEPSERRKIRKTRLDYTQRLIEVFERAQDDGHVVKDTESQLAVFLMLGACNWTSRWYRSGEWSPEYIASVTAGMLLRGVLTSEGNAVAEETGLLPEMP